ncbi:hypothetical protein KIN20_019919 [Parelaphostrongylus tenuis]|uniref:Mitochondrial cytochrome c oxidase subunit VIc/VIIs domain-containing protein n=1 Tax=Parelaphostrongylus tenuis TaxID=148309 RepID=A0AAD5QT69_PARTN|nr:hypothetical protein KIN20_019919 [Parelaphostrongylus tenuis]
MFKNRIEEIKRLECAQTLFHKKIKHEKFEKKVLGNILDQPDLFRMSAPPFQMRGMIHSYAKKGLAFAFTAAVASTVAFNLFYVIPRAKKYEEFFKNYDPYTRMKEICSEGTGYMHTCPKDLALMYEAKGKKIAPL